MPKLFCHVYGPCWCGVLLRFVFLAVVLIRDKMEGFEQLCFLASSTKPQLNWSKTIHPFVIHSFPLALRPNEKSIMAATGEMQSGEPPLPRGDAEVLRSGSMSHRQKPAELREDMHVEP